MGEAKLLSQKSSLPLCSNALLPSGILVTMCATVTYFFFSKRTDGYENKQTDFENDFSPVFPLLVS